METPPPTSDEKSGSPTRGQRNNPEKITMLHYEFIAAWMRAQAKTERGASLVEYALLVALIAVVCIAAVTLLGRNASEKFSEVSSSIE